MYSRKAGEQNSAGLASNFSFRPAFDVTDDVVGLLVV